jgi:glycerol-3-phosphate cytidylyltransferase
VNDLTVYTGGTFDLFHAGHVNFLKKCAALGKVTVSLNTDEFIEEYKQKLPVMSYAEREAVLASCSYVNRVIPNLGGRDSKPAILLACPDIIAIGTDWAKKDYYSQMNFTQEWLDNNDISLCYIPYSANISSTQIKERIRKIF